MRRKEREITEKNAIRSIIEECKVLRLGFYDEEKDEVYIVPVNFGCEEKDGKLIFYIHGAKEGRKAELIKRTGRAGFELDCGCKITDGPSACAYSANYKSIVGKGSIRMIPDSDRAEKRHALMRIMLKNTGKADWEFPDAATDAVMASVLEVTELCAKAHI